MAAPQKATVRLDPKNGTDFVVSLTKDASGNVWFGTEDAGIWRQDSKGKWTQFTTKDGLGDNNAYCLSLDREGRIWAGHLNHGVSVFNGQKWRNYDVLDGPLGERVFAIAPSPVDDDVWMATNAGLTRYSEKTKSWKHYTRADGLPSNQLSALSIDSLGNLYVGTQCDGLGIGHMEGDFKNWDIIQRTKDTGPDTYPANSSGSGLPSNLINDVLIADNDIIYVATTCGLARSSNFGVTWTYLRGADWEEKLRGLYKPVAAETPKENLNRELLREDYVTCLAEDEKGLLWIGYRQKGYEIRRPLNDRVALVSAVEASDQFPYVSNLLPEADGHAIIASYGDGLSKSEAVPPFSASKEEIESLNTRRGWKQVAPPEVAPPLPFPSAAPTAAELTRLLNLVRSAPTWNSTQPSVTPLDEDWKTQGEWLGRYGRYNALLCAMASPTNLTWGPGEKPLEYNLQISPYEKGNSIRHWVHWLSTDNNRVLEMPPLYFQSRLQRGLTTAQNNRRQSEVDDNGEAYPLTKEGPNVYLSVRIPKGIYTLSFYNHNKDGHSGMNRMRDYRYSIRSHSEKKPLYDLEDFAKQPELARSRQRDFWGGVYQRFLVHGPQELTVEIAKNNSFNVILAGVFLDLVDEHPPPYYGSFGNWETKYDAEEGERQGYSELEINPTPDMIPRDESEIANQLWQSLERIRVLNPDWWASNRREFYVALAKWLEQSKKVTTAARWPELLQKQSDCFYYSSLFEPWEAVQKRQGIQTAREIEKSLVWDGKSPTTGNNRSLIELH